MCRWPALLLVLVLVLAGCRDRDRNSRITVHLSSPQSTIYELESTSAIAYLTTHRGAWIQSHRWYLAIAPNRDVRIVSSWSRSTEVIFWTEGTYVLAFEVIWRTRDNELRYTTEYLEIEVLPAEPA